MGSWLRANRAYSSEHAPVIARPRVLLVRGPTPCTVRLKVVLRAECVLRDLLGTSHPPVSTDGWAGGLGAGWGLCPAGSRTLAKAPPPRFYPGVEAAANLFPSLPQQPEGSGGLHGTQSWGPGHCLGGLKSLRAGWVLGAWLPQWWWLSRLWGPGSRELPAEICLLNHWMNTPGQGNQPIQGPLLLARICTLEGKSRALGPCPFLSEQRIIFVLGEIYRNSKEFGVFNAWATCPLV